MLFDILLILFGHDKNINSAKKLIDIRELIINSLGDPDLGTYWFDNLNTSETK